MNKSFFSILATLALVAVPILTNADHAGDYYDNRDGNHANMGTSSHPGLTYMSSGYSTQMSIIPSKVVFGNASLAYTSGVSWGSLTRANHLRSETGMNASYNLYTNNNAYWYPEHLDHDAIDYYFAQSPTYSNSQGSSGSEIDEMHNWFYTLNAFKPETKSLLTSKKLIVPTTQMIARRTRVATDEEYMKGEAHPNAFDNYNNKAAMVNMAATMEASKIPPMVQVKVIEEDYNKINSGMNFFEPTSISKEKHFDTPVSISRIFHSFEYTRRMVVSAESSYDVNSLPLTYHWKVLRGDPSHVRIHPLNANSSRVEILIDYHPEAAIGTSTRLSNLVSVGAFVHNGSYYSAPAFITSYTKRNETRIYDTVTHKIKSILYNTNQLDRIVSYTKTWQSDEFIYDSAGQMKGWKRIKDGVSYDFTKEGYLVETRDVNGNIDTVSTVVYKYGNTTDYSIIWEKTGTPFKYSGTASTCSSFTYSTWSVCTNNLQTRTVTSSYPANCTGGTPLLSQSCSIAPATYTLTTSRAGTGEGVITGTGISCGTDCSETLLQGTTVTLTANPSSGSKFSGWSGACTGTQTTCNVTVNSSITALATFTKNETTPPQEDTTPPTLSNVTLAKSGSQGLILTWTTTEPATTRLDYGTSANLGLSTQEDTTLTLTHSVTLTKLQRGTNYHVQARSRDAVGNIGVSTILTITIPTKPGKISNLSAKAGSVVLLWKLPKEMTFTKITIYRDSVLVATLPQNATTYRDTSVEPSTSYKYEIYTVDDDDVSSDPVSVSFKTPREVSQNKEQTRTPSVSVDEAQTKTQSLGSGVIVTPSVEIVTTPPAEATLPTAPQNYTFTAFLKIGVTHPDVKALQEFLNARDYTIAVTGEGSRGNETTFFGSETQKAVTKFQKAYGVADTSSYGLVGPKTRAKLNELQ